MSVFILKYLMHLIYRSCLRTAERIVADESEPRRLAVGAVAGAAVYALAAKSPALRYADQRVLAVPDIKVNPNGKPGEAGGPATPIG